jgi:2-iminobutanoate/2-iminopropanoate deaminase
VHEGRGDTSRPHGAGVQKPVLGCLRNRRGTSHFLSGCCTVPTYHKHPHDPEEERQWLKGDFREQTERTFAHIKEIMDAAGARMTDILKLTIFTTDMDSQNILNEVSARYFGNQSPPARTLVGVPTLAHPGMLIEIEGVAAAPAKT